MPVDQFNGVHLLLAHFVTALPFDSTKHYVDYVARLNQVPRVIDQLIAVLEQGEKDKLTAAAEAQSCRSPRQSERIGEYPFSLPR